jgi:hypothetical protein
MTEDPFDPTPLRRADHRVTAPPSLHSRTLEAMFEAYEDEVRAQGEDDVVLLPVGPPGEEPRGRWFASAVAIAVAAAALVVVALWPQNDDQAEIATSPDVSGWCLAVANDLLVPVERFLEDPGGERTEAALRSLETLSQALADLVDSGSLDDPELPELVQRLQDRAADARLAAITGEDARGSLSSLAGDTATVIERLPGSDACDLDLVRGR